MKKAKYVKVEELQEIIDMYRKEAQELSLQAHVYKDEESIEKYDGLIFQLIGYLQGFINNAE